VLLGIASTSFCPIAHAFSIAGNPLTRSTWT
jgi:hypothetical protein